MNAHIPCMLKGEPVHFVIQSKDKNGNGAWLQLNGECIGWEGDDLSYRLHQYHRHYRTEGVAKETGETVKAT